MIVLVIWCWLLCDIDLVFLLLKIDIWNEWNYKTWGYQEILDLKNEVSTLMSNFKDDIQQKFETMNNRLNTKENSIKTIILDQVSESIVKVKDSVTEALKEDNLKI